MTVYLFAVTVRTLRLGWCLVWSAQETVTPRSHQLEGTKTVRPAQPTLTPTSLPLLARITAALSALLDSILTPVS